VLDAALFLSAYGSMPKIYMDDKMRSVEIENVHRRFGEVIRTMIRVQ